MPSQPVQFGRYAPARRVIVHLSDTHLLAGNRLLGGRYDTAANLAATLAAVERTGVRPDAIVFTGDLTDLGEPEAYADGGKRAVGFKLSEGMEPPAELDAFKWARQKSKLAGTIRGSYFVIKGEHPPID